jgi:hypothetical protein
MAANGIVRAVTLGRPDWTILDFGTGVQAVSPRKSAKRARVNTVILSMAPPSLLYRTTQRAK